jgi:hypothetical protein
MWVSLRKYPLVAIAAWAFASQVARADDLLVMPYACSVRDGRAILRPIRDDEGYRIFGRREQRSFTACSPVNPGMCRQWTIYRFDVDCDGRRVPWVSIAAAAARIDGLERMWVEDGRLRIDMGPAWSMGSDERCFMPYDSDDDDRRWRFRRLERDCLDREPREAASSVVDLPPGFAPMLGLDAIFVAGGASSTDWGSSTAPPHEANPPSSRRADTENAAPPASSPQPAQKSARGESPAPAAPDPAAKGARPESGPPSSALPELAAKGARIAGLPPPPQQAAQSAASAPAAPATPTKPTGPKQAEAKPETPPPSPAPAAVPGGPVIPRIINRPAARPDEASPQPAAKLAAAPPVPPKETVVPAGPVEKAVATRSEETPLNLMSVVRSPATGAAIVGGALAVLLLAAFALTRRRERAQLASAPARDIATVSLDGGGAALPGTPEEPSRQVWSQAGRHPSQPAPAQKPAMPSNWGDRIPATREEALQVLGMGVTPDANVAAIKKIVDGLRASWHPDHASGGADRQLRELRMKQINAAWEIIAGKRGGA